MELKLKEKRFEIITKETMGLTRETAILRDKVTGICYLYHAAGYGGGLTPLLDKNGNPIIDTGYERR